MAAPKYGNLSVVLQEKKKLALEDKPIPEPGKDEVQIAMHAVGICGSDIHMWMEGSIGVYVSKSPMTLGHESSGVVSKVGENVDHLKVGDRVSVEPGVPCGSCYFCREGRYNLCKDMFFRSAPPNDKGCFARYISHNAAFCYKMPDNMSFEEGALCEPLSVAIHACRRGGVSLGHKVLITGAGPIGLLSMLSAKAMGVSEICVTDISSKRLEFAKKMGANHTILVDSNDSNDTKALAEKVRISLGSKPDVTIECSGVQSSTELGIYAIKDGGCVVLIGMGADKKNIPLVYAICHEIDIKGVHRYANTWPTAMHMISSGVIDVKPLVTHRFSLEDALEAFEVARSGVGVKVMIMSAVENEF